jgi:bifunctional aspartokinase / homoserine dehydrogenase 1
MKKIFLFLCLFLFSSSYAESERQVQVFLLGTGLVGSELLHQIDQSREILQQQYGVEIVVVGAANSKTMLLNSAGLTLEDWKKSPKDLMSWDSFLDAMLNGGFSHPVFVDCTSSVEVAGFYEEILQTVPIVTASKKANSSLFEKYKNLHEKDAGFYYDANVGAGLPILSTIQSLKRSADEITRIEAVFSGTLSFLFNSFKEGVLFSELVKRAQEMGYTEPDPRDDLNGMDVARKLLITAREAGFTMEMEEIKLEMFLPDSCFKAASVEEFYERLKEYDPVFTEKRRKAESEGKRLRFIAKLENGKASISLQAVDQSHPFYHLSGNDNIASISSKHYCRNPIVIQGPGAGATVTAAIVLEGIVLESLKD